MLPASAVGWDIHDACVNRVCYSGLTAIIYGARMLRVGDATVVVAAGVESMPVHRSCSRGRDIGLRFYRVARPNGLGRAYRRVDFESMRAPTERPNERFEMTCQATMPSPHALPSARPLRTRRASRVRDRPGQDPAGARRAARHHRRDARGLRRRVREEENSITVGNASQIFDGTLAVVFTTRFHADENGWEVLVVVGASGQVADSDNSLDTQPTLAIEKALAQQVSALPSSTWSRLRRRSARSPPARRAKLVARTKPCTRTAVASR
ncbi:MAG: hypothetical protein ABWX92_03860 [Mycetocola sp.]